MAKRIEQNKKGLKNNNSTFDPHAQEIEKPKLKVLHAQNENSTNLEEQVILFMFIKY